MPGPAALAVPSALLALKRMVMQASVYYSPEVATAVTSATIITFVANWLWKYIPVWIKEDISFQTLFWSRAILSDDGEGNKSPSHTRPGNNQREELSNLASVLKSLNRMTNSMEQLHEIPQLHAAILAFIQWSAQMKRLQLLPGSGDNGDETTLHRDFAYETSGQGVPLEQVQTPQHQEALEFATWAYYRDIREEDGKSKLSKMLQKKDFELICHEDPTTRRPGQVAFYVAISGIRRQVYIGVRGTSSLEDMVTDCCGHAATLVEHEEERGRIEVEAAKPPEIRLTQQELVSEECYQIHEVEIISGHERIRVEANDDQGDNHVRCHEGILISAQRMSARLDPILQDWAIDAGYRVVLCGHR